MLWPFTRKGDVGNGGCREGSDLQPLISSETATGSVQARSAASMRGPSHVVDYHLAEIIRH